MNLSEFKKNVCIVQEQSVRYWGDSAKLGTLHPLFDSCFCEQTRN